MFRRLVYSMVSVWLLFSLLSSAARAQYNMMGGFTPAGSGQTISAAGTATVRKMPSSLRMHIELVAKEKSLEEALDKMKDRREAALVQLDTLGADKDSIRFGDPSLSSDQSEQRRNIEKMIAQRMRGRDGAPPKGLQISKSVTVSTTLIAQ